MGDFVPMRPNNMHLPLSTNAPAESGRAATDGFTFAPAHDDPYRYMQGFGNRFASEAVPGSLPECGRNIPQRCAFDLYAEQLNGTSFISSRSTLQHVWMYRIRPSVAHRPLTSMPPNDDVQACFGAANPSVLYTPLTYTWGPLDITPVDSDDVAASVTFVQGLKTLCGHGDPTAQEGIAVHMYAANTSMRHEAFCNNDGDMLLIPTEGRLDIQTELGNMMVCPGEIAVVQAGLRWRVVLPDTDAGVCTGAVARGYVQEIFGSHYELPELGPLGSNGMALPKDFKTPVARFNLDEDGAPIWTVIVKLAGKFYRYEQLWSPFDVVAWHGNYAPYKYGLEHFVAFNTTLKEQVDPTIHTVLMARSKTPGVSLTEFAAFLPRWQTNTDTFRPPYYHRNMAAELGGLICGTYAGSAREQVIGGLSFENSYMPHGETYAAWRRATTEPLKPILAGTGSIGFMLHISCHMAVTTFAMHRHTRLLLQRPALWDDVRAHFYDHIPAINQMLADKGLPAVHTTTAAGVDGESMA